MKTEEEKKLDSLMNDYLDMFDENYPMFFTDMRSTEEVIEDIESCLKNKKKKKQPKIRKDLIY